MTLTRS